MSTVFLPATPDGIYGRPVNEPESVASLPRFGEGMRYVVLSKILDLVETTPH